MTISPVRPRGSRLKRASPPRVAGLFPAALGTTVTASAAPYGYTISIWSAGALLMGSHGVPRAPEVFAFLAGAVIGFGLIAAMAQGALARCEPLDHAPARVLAGAMNWLAAGAAVGAATLLSGIHGWLAWPLGSFAATAIYLLGASLQLALATARGALGDDDVATS